jgi:hypothetical protein
MLGSSNLTGTNDAQRLTEPGMAFFADTGPLGETCGDCKFKGYWRQRADEQGVPLKPMRSGGCAKFHALTGTHGRAIDKNLRACKYFEASKADA